MVKICCTFLLFLTIADANSATNDVFERCGAELRDAFRLICYDEAAKAEKNAEKPTAVARTRLKQTRVLSPVAKMFPIRLIPNYGR
jgi:hypothetical protein